MNLKIIVFLVGIIALQFSLQSESECFAENLGGAGGDTFVVDNKDDLKQYAGLSEPHVIIVKSNINGGFELRKASFKTIAGVGFASTII